MTKVNDNGDFDVILDAELVEVGGDVVMEHASVCFAIEADDGAFQGHGRLQLPQALVRRMAPYLYCRFAIRLKAIATDDGEE